MKIKFENDLKYQLEALDLVIIFRDSGFPSDAAKTNAVQTLFHWGISKLSSILETRMAMTAM